MSRLAATLVGIVVRCGVALIVQSLCLHRDFDILIADKRHMVAQLESQLAHEQQLVCSDICCSMVDRLATTMLMMPYFHRTMFQLCGLEREEAQIESEPPLGHRDIELSTLEHEVCGCSPYENWRILRWDCFFPCSIKSVL